MTREAKDALMEGAAWEQRTKGMMPRPRENAEYIDGLLTQMDRKATDAKPVTVKPKPESSAEQIREAFERRMRDKGRDVGNLEITRGPKETVKVSDLMSQAGIVKLKTEAYKRLARRVRMLRRYPEWRQRLNKVNGYGAMSGAMATEKRREVEKLYWRIIEDSNRVFGHWSKDAPTKLIFSGK